MKRKRRADPEWDGPPVVGVDLPYPPGVQEALDRVASETQRQYQAECEHERTDLHFSERRSDLGKHAERVRERYCTDCDLVLGTEPVTRTPVYGFPFEYEAPKGRTATYRIPLEIGPMPAKAETGPLEEYLLQEMKDTIEQIHDLEPRSRGPMRG